MPIFNPVSGTQFKTAGLAASYAADAVISAQYVNRAVNWVGAVAGTLTLPSGVPSGSAFTIYNAGEGVCVISPGTATLIAQGNVSNAGDGAVRLYTGDSITVMNHGGSWRQVAGHTVRGNLTGTLAGKSSEIINVPMWAKLIKFYGQFIQDSSATQVLNVRVGSYLGVVSGSVYRNHNGAGTNVLFGSGGITSVYDYMFTLRRLNDLTWAGEASAFELVPIAVTLSASPGYIAMPAALDRVQLLAAGTGFTAGTYEIGWE